MYSNLSLDTLLSLSLEEDHAKYDCQGRLTLKQWKKVLLRLKRGIRHCIITILNKLYIYVYIKQFYKYYRSSCIRMLQHLLLYEIYIIYKFAYLTLWWVCI